MRYPHPVPRYTIQLESAWLIVEKLRDANPWQIHVGTVKGKHGKPLYWCEFLFADNYCTDVGNPIVFKYGVTPAEAICLAALEAIKEQK